MPKTYPVRKLYKNFEVFNVLDDFDTFSGVDNCQIIVYPDTDKLTDEQLDDLENGKLPNDGYHCSIDLTKLLNEAMEAKLDCVKPLLELIKKK